MGGAGIQEVSAGLSNNPSRSGRGLRLQHANQQSMLQKKLLIMSARTLGEYNVYLSRS
jgi:hypothetical protein